jgi:tetratricopeptide (TPR) repeat protein
MTRRRIGIVLIGLAILIAAASACAAWWRQVELNAARDEVARGSLAQALQRLERLEWLPPIARSAEQSFLLGMARWSAGRYEPALRAFARIPPDDQLAIRTAMFQAEAALRDGRLRLAEETLLRVVAGSGPVYEPALDWLERVYRLQARYDEVRELMRSRLRSAGNPATVLASLWRLDRSTVPVESIRAGLDEASSRAGGVEDDRIWLGRARLSLLEGQPQKARTCLDRCLAAVAPASPDPPIWRAWLDWAAIAEQPGEVARALDQLGASRLSAAETWFWRAWLAQRDHDTEAEWQALQKALELEPHRPGVLERLASQAIARGQPALARSIRDRKALVDWALLDYDGRIKELSTDSAKESPTGARCLELAGLAEAAGRPFDASAWAILAAAHSPPGDQAHALADRLSRLSETALAPAGDAEGIPKSWSLLVTGHERTAAEAAVESGRRSAATTVEFRDEAASAGLNFRFDNGESPLHQMPEPLCGGLGLLDYDGDGWLDIFVAQGGRFPPGPAARGDRLFRNRGDGTFEDATERAGIAALPQGYGHGVAVGDIDNDGDPDLFVARWRSYSLYRNDGGRFVDATAAAGLAGDRDWPTSAAFADLDGDGDLDLYVCHYLAWDADNPRLCRNARNIAYVSCSPLQLPAIPDHVFRNDGGRFVDVTASAGFVDPAGRGLAVLAAHLDEDMKIDLFVANDMTANFLFHN